MRLSRFLMAAFTAVASLTLGAGGLSAASATAARAKTSTITARSDAAYTPSAENGGTDDYHCTLINPHLTHNSFIVSSQFFPGTGKAAREVHHAILFMVPPSLAADARAANAGGKGWTCFGEPPVLGKGIGQFLSMPWLSEWAPGHGRDIMPAGTGTPLPAGSLIVMQVHYNLLVGDRPVRPHVQLDTVPASTKLRPTSIQPLVSVPNIPCPDGVTGPLCDRTAELADLSKRFGAYMTMFDAGVERICGKDPIHPPEGNSTSCMWHIAHDGYIVRTAPHMHLVGTSMRITLDPGTPQAKILMNTPHYNFDDQRANNPSKWIRVKAGQSVEVSCHYNPRLAQKLPALRKLPPHYITWGDGSSDEMCLGLMWSVPASTRKGVDWANPTGGFSIGGGSGNRPSDRDHAGGVPPTTAAASDLG